MRLASRHSSSSGASASTRTSGSVPDVATQELVGLLRGLQHRRGIHGRILVGDAHVVQALRVELDRTREHGERLALGTRGLHQAQRGHDAVARGLQLAKDDVARLLAAQGIAVLTHAGVHETV